MAANPAPSMKPSMNYHMLASLMSLEPDFTIFRRFRAANTRDLLRLQGEITQLERQLQLIIAADRASKDPETAEFEFCIASLKGPPHPRGEKSLQYEKQVELGRKLETYRTALLQYKQLCELPSANKVGLANLREVLNINGDHRGFPRGLENTIWSEENEADLTSLTDPYSEMDVCSKWIHSHLLRWYHNILGHRLHDPISLAEASVQLPITHYSNRKLTAIVNAMSTIFSPLLPAASMVALFFIQNELARTAAIVAFCLLFSVVLTIITNPRRVDCFTATATFAAVQVVFITTAISNQQVN